MTIHGIPATSWQLEAAAAGRLRAIVLPLPYSGEIDCDNVESTLPLLSDRHKYKKGDRIYLQEEWCKGDWGNAFCDDIYFTKSTTPEAENIGWQPASVMPKEAAQHWFKVTEVQVCKCKNLSSDASINANLSTIKLVGVCNHLSNEERENKIQEHVNQVVQRWNSAYPEQLWDSDRWVVVLTVKKDNA